jgi:hypothetical protein
LFTLSQKAREQAVSTEPIKEERAVLLVVEAPADLPFRILRADQVLNSLRVIRTTERLFTASQVQELRFSKDRQEAAAGRKFRADQAAVTFPEFLKAEVLLRRKEKPFRPELLRLEKRRRQKEKDFSDKEAGA